MTTLTQTQTAVSIEDYLEGEQHTDIKHEYLGGRYWPWVVPATGMA